MNKPTEAEVIKALECCINKKCITKNCPYSHEEGDADTCTTLLAKDTLDLINRLKAENERLVSGIIQTYNTTPELIKQAKAEAYKEFFKLVHSEFKTISDYQYGKLNITFCSNFQVAIDKLKEIYRKLEGGTSV